MGSNEDTDKVRADLAIISEVVKVAGTQPGIIEAGSNIGKAVLTVTKAINLTLLPLAALNYGYEKAHEYFENKFEQDLSQKASTIPADSVQAPKVSIAGPALHGLAFVHDEVDLKDMYLNLLSTAMDSRVAETAHPAFVEIIKQLTAAEAKMLQSLMANRNSRGIVEIRSVVDESSWSSSWQIVARHVMDLKDSSTGERVADPEFPTMIDNWTRLGIVEVDYTVYLDNDDYRWVTERPEHRDGIAKEEDKNRKIIFQKGVIRPTDLGMRFAHAVGITPSPES